MHGIRVSILTLTFCTTSLLFPWGSTWLTVDQPRLMLLPGRRRQREHLVAVEREANEKRARGTKAACDAGLARS